MADGAAAGRILVVDDEADIRALLADILAEAGYEVMEAAGGRAGLIAVGADPPPDLVLLDLSMPDLDGWAVLDHLGALPAAPPVIVVSGGGQRTRPGPLGGCVMGFLPKPFRVHDVVATVQRTLAAVRQLQPVGVYQERRRGPRRPLLVEAKLLTREGAPLALGKIVNLSPAGAQLDLGASLEPGNTVRLSFEIPGVAGPIVLDSRVQWRNSGTMGLAFVGLGPAQADRLKEILAED